MPTLTKAEAEYRDYPKAGKSCGLCSMFRRPHGCTLVQGKIDSFGWCKNFDQKKTASVKDKAA